MARGPAPLRGLADRLGASRQAGAPDPTVDRDAFSVRCAARQRERALGTGHGFGIFFEGRFCGEINLSSIQRGPFQNAYVGYWIDQRWAGNGYMPESVVVLARFAFEELHLHRLQISIIPRNTASRRVVEKLGLRDEGIALRYLEIDGVWEDHVRYDQSYERPTEVDALIGDASKAREVLGWKPSTDAKGLAELMVDADIDQLGRLVAHKREG